jgi:hypothetical protein
LIRQNISWYGKISLDTVSRHIPLANTKLLWKCSPIPFGNLINSVNN